MLAKPSGHLDVDSIRWLEDWLEPFPSSITCTSQLFPFLVKVCTHIIDFQDCKLKTFKGEKVFRWLGDLFTSCRPPIRCIGLVSFRKWPWDRQHCGDDKKQTMGIECMCDRYAFHLGRLSFTCVCIQMICFGVVFGSQLQIAVLGGFCNTSVVSIFV